MQNFIYSAEILMPIVILIFIGYILQHLKIFNNEFIKSANVLAFKVFLPILLFYNIFSQDKILESINLRLIAFAFVIVIFLWALLMVIVPKFVKDNRRTGVMIQGMFRSNFLLFGIPLSGKFGTISASIFAACYVPLINLLANLTLYKFSPDENKSFKKAIISSLTNPLFLGGALGLLMGITRELIGYNIPYFIGEPLKEIRNLATPFAFILLGGDLKFRNLFKNIKYSLTATLIKTLAFPAIILPIAYFVGFTKMEFGIILAAAATPNAVASYTMVRNYKADYELAGELVVLSTVISIFTLFILLSLASTLGLIDLTHQPL